MAVAEDVFARPQLIAALFVFVGSPLRAHRFPTALDEGRVTLGVSGPQLGLVFSRKVFASVDPGLFTHCIDREGRMRPHDQVRILAGL